MARPRVPALRATAPLAAEGGHKGPYRNLPRGHLTCDTKAVAERSPPHRSLARASRRGGEGVSAEDSPRAQARLAPFTDVRATFLGGLRPPILF